jgi:hypothetical protein
LMNLRVDYRSEATAQFSNYVETQILDSGTYSHRIQPPY